MNKCLKKSKKRHYKHLAAAVAGAAILSSAALPAVVHAALPINDTLAPPEQTVSHTAEPDAPAKLNPAFAPDQKNIAEAEPIVAKINGTPVKLPDNFPDNYQKSLNITATAYAPGPHDNDQWGNKTFLGTRIRPGVIAVDPKIIPLGSLVYILYPNGHGTYAVAEDTGGAIKGHRIDVAKWTVSEAEDFGIQHVKVYVVNTPDEA